MKQEPSSRVVAAFALGAILAAVGCTGGTPEPAPGEGAALPRRTFDASMVFPADGSLMRAEDGVALADGRLIVADQAAGLRMIDTDGRSEPFGNMPAAGYRHDPPEHGGGANGVAFEPGGTHLLVADIHHGGIYRVEVATGDTELIHWHRYGVNTAVRDSRGAIWFTQSAHNAPGEGEARMWAAVDTALAEGALYRLEMQGGRPAAEAELLVDSLLFANGIAIDEAAGHLYVAETMGARVLRYRVDLETGRLSERTVLVEGVMPDNLELDGAGRLWVAAPLTNEMVLVDTATATRRSVFQVQTPAQQAIAAEVLRRVQAGEPCLELLTPDLWAPLPGLVTGAIVGAHGGPIYLTGLGNALIRLDASAPGSTTMTPAELNDFATRYAAAWSGQRPERLASFYAEDGSLTVNDGAPSAGRAAITATARGFMDAFPDMVVRMDSVSPDGRRATFRWTWTGTNTGPGGTGRPVRISGYEAWTFGDDGLLQESRGHYDQAEYRRQMSGGGAPPTPGP